jgi:DNA modification methylase
MTGPYWFDDTVALHAADCRDLLPTLPDASVDAVITDPPYEIGIAGRDWDRSGIAYDPAVWAEVLRVAKPGAHLLSFGATRTYHRMVVAAEDARWQVLDQLDWIYTTGKPRGVDLARAIDRRRDDRTDVLKVTAWLKTARDAAGWDNARINALFGFASQAKHWTTQGVTAAVPSVEQWDRLVAGIGVDDSEMRPLVAALNARKGTPGEAFAAREVISERREAPRTGGLYGDYSGRRVKARAASGDARRWEGWNTALRPAHDPILLARKGTGFHSLTASLLEHGTGALHVDACRTAVGGWPTNVLLGHDCEPGACVPGCPVRDIGAAGASFPVFRLEPRTPAAERVEVDGVRHDTPKPLALMRWLVRLVCPPGGLVLDPFAGSGTTLLAARSEGARAIGIEQQEPYAAIAAARLGEPVQRDLFGEVA